ncbi:putative ATP-dependent RNA helicase [Trypanosoma conorhini]|uniref:ATP-dependent RNA helicase n=1 Tax=Trypanosoma conorhini TaxID=83891 RepID=A0A422PAC0_9TRYP|nr:putative ATP-dependent RNA helicase [Trypanosoma conorhini]RNF14659.1 putative ATP-dependent RNA helicase [Trypanosoma conorhini]
MSLKKATFKQRARKNEMKERHRVASEVRKRMRAAKRRHNRYDGIDSGSRPLEALVEEIAAGSAAPTREVTFDPRSLTDLLLRPVEGEKGANGSNRLALPETPLPEDHPLSLPTVQLDERDGVRDGTGGSTAANKNQYRHHGDPYLFWERVGLHPLLLGALRSMRFAHPTPVQEEVLPSVLFQGGGEEAVAGATSSRKGSKKQRGCGKDVIISAETGSGKTLAFALPILHQILSKMPSNEHSVTNERETVENDGEAKEERKEKRPTKKRVETGKKFVPVKEGGASDDVKNSGSGVRKRVRDETPGKVEEASSPTMPAAVPKERLMQALIISPTRELALQINEAFLQLTQHARHVVIGCVVGGMAPEKQQRVLNRHPHVLICTPGRLWELVQKNEGCYLGHSISRRLSFVVLDEADKLLQSGRFEELKNLLERIHCEVLPAGFVQEREEGAEAAEMELEAGRWDDEAQKFVPFSKNKEKDTNAAGDPHEQQQRRRKDVPRPIPMPPNPAEGHRTVTFVTSATLSLQTNYERKDLRAKKTVIRTTNADTMATVLQQLEIKPSNAKVFTFSPKADVTAKIQETYLRCPGDSKDLYLYYFLKMYHERTIVFVNAISMLRRLVKLLEVLGIPVAGLHASLQQRQRLKYIDKFRKGEKRVLVATDIASRGLDVEGLKHVIHFQVPRSTDAYIHRCGRTARCGGTGLSILMINAQEHVSFQKLMDSLGRGTSEMEMFALQPTIVHQLHSHVKVAMQIDKLQKEIDKSRARNNWAHRMSREADIEVDDMVDDEADNENRAKEKAIKVLQKRLELLVKKDMGTAGGKGGFRTSAQALGARSAESKLVERATMQVTQAKHKKKQLRRAHS